MSTLTDEDLMTAVTNGNLDSMSFLFERYHVRIFNFLYKMSRDRDLSEDLTQDVFFKAIKYRSSYKGGKFAAWIFAIARNGLNNHYGKQKVRLINLDEVSYKLDNRMEDTTEEVEHLNSMLSKLNDNERELIVLNRFQEIRYEELAQITGSSIAAIKVKVHRAIKKLKTHYFQNSEQ